MTERPQSERAEASLKIDPQTVREIVGAVGAGLAGYGAWLAYAPAGFMVGGGILVGMATIGTLRGAK